MRLPNLQLGDYLAIVGFAIVLWQIRRAGNLAKAAKDAVEQASSRSSKYTILLLAAHFEKCEAQLEAAAIQSDVTLLLEKFREWRRVVHELQPLVRSRHDCRELRDALATSLTLAAAAKNSALSTTAKTSLLHRTTQFRESTSTTAGLVVTLAASERHDLAAETPQDDLRGRMADG